MRKYRLELVCESGADEPEETMLRNSMDVAQLLSSVFAGVDREMFVVVLVDAKHRPIGINTVSTGSLTSTVVHPRETFKAAIAGNAAAVFLGHLHPSGDPEPSSEDREITRRLRDAGELLGIRVLDHIIVGDGDRYYSFVDSGAW